jgi:hypothetical protein
MRDPLEFAARLIARRLAEKWDATLERDMRSLIGQDCFADALLMAQELQDRRTFGMCGELCDNPGRIKEARVQRRASEILRLLDARSEVVVVHAGEDRRAEPGGSGEGPRAERMLERLTAT